MPRFSRKLAQRNYNNDEIYYDIDPEEMRGNSFDEQDDDFSDNEYYPN